MSNVLLSIDQSSTPRLNRLRSLLVLPAVLALVVAGHSAAEEEQPAGRPLVALPRTVPAPQDNPTTRAKVALGRQLFFDPRLSGDNTMSCATCHLPEKAFGDGLALGKGAKGNQLTRNTQSLLNVGLYGSYFWDGRAKSLEEQALGPIQSPEEMNQDLKQLVRELNDVPGYRTQFRQVFDSDVTEDSLAKALASFQRTLLTGPSPFDRYLQGDQQALSRSARRGLELFEGEAGCVQCHRGPLLSDGKFYRLGASFSDEGLAKITGRKEDRGRFRTPSLRNIAETGPYMHNGSLKTLDEVVTFYYRGIPPAGPNGEKPDVQPLAGRSFTEIADLVAFLKSLSGQPPEVTPPALP